MNKVSPYKTGGGGLPQEYDPSNGQYGSNSFCLCWQDHQIPMPNLSRSQSKAMEHGAQIIRDHLRGTEYEAIIIELSGGVIQSKGGKVYNHIKEVTEALSGLQKCISSLSGSLSNPNLDEPTRHAIKNKRAKFQKTYKKFSSILKGEGK